MANKQTLLSSGSGSMRLSEAAIKQWKRKVKEESEKAEQSGSGSQRKIVFS